MSISPRLVMADAAGNVVDHPKLLMLGSRAGYRELPKPGELIPLPQESELFLLPGRRAAGLNPQTGRVETVDGLAVAAFAAPGYTLSASPAYEEDAGAPVLPLFAYGAVGYARGRFWICGARVDPDQRQRFGGIKPGRIENECRKLLAAWPANRLVGHIVNNCVRRYACPAARNFALGRYEAPLPTSRTCNARCLGCISLQSGDSPIPATPQCRLAFTPKPAEIAQVMFIHAAREKKRPIYSFGQGCEGDPLANPDLLCESVRIFRRRGGPGTVNCNTNASDSSAVGALARGGLTSMRVSLNSARPELYKAYYRPLGYDFGEVRKSVKTAACLGIFVSLNLLFFPGISDTAAEIEALADLCGDGVGMIQLRNLNIDPVWYPRQLGMADPASPSLGLAAFLERLGNACPWLRFGYFNPYLGEKAVCVAGFGKAR